MSLGESAAFATCGDYLAPMRGHDEAVPGLQGLPMNGDPGNSSDHAPAAPCRGPHCRSNNKVPFAPSAPTVKIVAEQWAVDFVCPADDRTPAASPLDGEADLCGSQYLSEPPLRPPRAA